MEERKQYEFEKKLACRLRESTQEERRRLYVDIYSELHDKFSQTGSGDKQARRGFRLIRSFFGRQDTVLEVGAGNLAITRKIAQRAKKVVALEVARGSAAKQKAGIKIINYNGVDFPDLTDKFEVALSFQVLEHLHPADVELHLEAVRNSLQDGGYYIVRTPHRFSGPHDVSRHFSKVASGLHLKEYTYQELIELARATGFKRVKSYLGQFGFKFWAPSWLLVFLEKYTAFLFKVFVRNILIVFYK